MKEQVVKLFTFKSTLKSNIFFAILLIVMALLYDYHSIVLMRPQSVHHWRQSDCASLALNYYQKDMNFFHPQTHNLTSDNSKTSFASPSEIPLWYYFVAILYKIFGYHDYIYRGSNTVIFLIGLFFLFKTFYYLFNSFFWSASITIFFFTSPILVYYGNNFLTDSSAFAFVLIAWYYFFMFYKTKSNKAFYLSMLFFLLAGSFKLFDLLSFLALFTIFLIDYLNIIKFKGNEKIFEKPKVQFLPFLIIFLIISSWVLYAHYYNEAHQAHYFSTSLMWYSLWNTDSDYINSVIHSVKYIWLDQIFYIPSLYFLGGIFIFTLFFLKKVNRFLLLMNLFLLLGSILYVLVFFAIFRDHDCYMINMFILPIFTFIICFDILKNHFPKIFSSVYFKVAFILLLLFNINHAVKQNHNRYYDWWTEYPEYKGYHTITPYLRSIGIQPLDTVVCLPDDSHFTLYLMNQVGWTRCKDYNTDSTGVALSIKRGAKFLIINGEKTLKEPYLQSFLNHPVGEYGNIKIFKLE